MRRTLLARRSCLLNISLLPILMSLPLDLLPGLIWLCFLTRDTGCGRGRGIHPPDMGDNGVSCTWQTESRASQVQYQALLMVVGILLRIQCEEEFVPAIVT